MSSRRPQVEPVPRSAGAAAVETREPRLDFLFRPRQARQASPPQQQERLRFTLAEAAWPDAGQARSAARSGARARCDRRAVCATRGPAGAISGAGSAGAYGGDPQVRRGRRHGLYALRRRLDRGAAPAGNGALRIDRRVARAHREQRARTTRSAFTCVRWLHRLARSPSRAHSIGRPTIGGAFPNTEFTTAQGLRPLFCGIWPIPSHGDGRRRENLTCNFENSAIIPGITLSQHQF